MAADVAPELYEKISAAFRKKYENATLYGEPIKNVEEILRKRTANFRDADLYATKVGAMLSEAMKEVMVLDELPNKTLYYNIAKRTIGSMLEDAYRMTATVASVVQEEINSRAGIGMKPAKVEMSVRQLNEIVSRASNSKTQEQLNSALTEPVKTFPRKAVDNTIRTNAKVHSEAGLTVRVVRKYDGVGVHDRKDPCEWCLSREGEWTYPEAMAAGVFERHDGCGCVIDYTSKKGERTRSTDKRGFHSIERDETAGRNVWRDRYTSNKKTEIKKYEESFKKAESIEEAEKFLGEKLGLSLEGYKSINLEVLNKTNFEIQKCFDAFGNLKEKGVLDGVRVLKGEGPEAAYSHAMKEVFYYKAKVAYKSSLAKMRETAIDNKQHCFWSTSSEMHGIRHELGHAIRYTISDTQYSKIDAIRREIMSKTGIEVWDMYDTIEHRKAAGRYLSYYGLKDTDEFIAESVAEFLNGDSRKTASDVVKILRGK